MQAEASLQDKFFDILATYYPELTARKLARSHVDAHEQFMAQLGMTHGGARPRKGPFEHKKKRPVRLRPTPTFGFGLDEILDADSPVTQETIETEILSLMLSVGATHRAVQVDEILEGCEAFAWSRPKIRRAIRKLEKNKQIEREGNYRSAGFLLPLDPNVPSGVKAEGLEADEPAYR